MAVLSKIREKSGFLILIIGLALFAFVASPKDILNFFSSRGADVIGAVNGQKIKKKDFLQKIQNYKTQMGGNVSELQAAKKVWEDMVKNYLYQNQLKESGIVIGEKEIWDKILLLPEIQNAPLFKNKAGFFDEDKFKNHIAQIKESTQNIQGGAWQSWLENEKNIKEQLEKETYNNLVSLGIGASLEDAKIQYNENNTQLFGKYVYAPYSAIEDEKVIVNEKEVENFINDHKKDFQVPESRDIDYVFFPLEASEEDKKNLKNDLESLKKDKEIYVNATKKKELSLGFQNTKNVQEFFEENDSDVPLNLQYRFRNVFPEVAADAIFAANKGQVVGPYEFEGYYKISKIVDVKKMPDSVKANHILISYKGASSADKNITKTEQQAQKTADSILKIVKKYPKKFKTLAKKFSADKSNSEKGGDLGWFPYNQMVPAFRDFCFENKTGKMGVVKTNFGFHIIQIKKQKNWQPALKVATYAKKIIPSEITENKVFEDAETYVHNLANGKNYEEIAKEKNYKIMPLVGLEKLDEKVGVLGNQRTIVRWAFDEENKVGDFKRFDVENGYAVVILNKKTEKGLMSATKAFSKVAPKIRKKKKENLIKAKIKGDNLKEIASALKTNIQNFENLTLENPILPEIGLEPAVVGAMYACKKHKIIAPIVGEKGIFVFEISKKQIPESLKNYENQMQELQKKYQNIVKDHLYEALKQNAAIEDHRTEIY